MDEGSKGGTEVPLSQKWWFVGKRL